MAPKAKKNKKEESQRGTPHRSQNTKDRRFHQETEEHLEKKTCPKPLWYSARANILADEQFKKDIKSVKEKAERSFVEALTRFHYRHVENQKSKFQKEKAETCHTNGSTNYLQL